jgi:VTC domain
VIAHAELQTGVDRKYLLPAAVCTELIPRLARECAALEIDGHRAFRYSSTCFDTPDLLTFREYRQGRRRRFKIRTRAYLDSRVCMLELKLSGARGATDKRRMPYDIARRTEPTDEIGDFLEDGLLTAYRMNTPDALGSVATTGYLRCTLVRLSAPGRVTFDRAHLHPRRSLSRCRPRPSADRIEVHRSRHPDRPATARSRVPSLKVSKYCLAVAVLYPEVRANPWHPVLRRWFGPPDSPARVSPPLLTFAM